MAVQLVFSILAEAPELAAPPLTALGAHPDFVRAAEARSDFLCFFQMIAAVQLAGAEFLFADRQSIPLLVFLPVLAQAPVLGLLERLGVLR